VESTARRVGSTTDGPEIGTRIAAGAAPVVHKMNYSKTSVISPAEQLAIVQYSDEHGVKAAANHFAVSQERVCDWRSDRRRREAVTSER
jgi:acetyl-CoA carboxylase alpha subunit